MNDKDNQKVDGRYVIICIFESLMSVLYLCMAYILIATKIFENIAAVFRIPFGILLAIYGVFRVYRAIRKLKSMKE